MGSIMDYEGHVFQVAATFTPLQQIDVKKNGMQKEAEFTMSAVNISKFM